MLSSAKTRFNKVSQLIPSSVMRYQTDVGEMIVQPVKADMVVNGFAVGIPKLMGSLTNLQGKRACVLGHQEVGEVHKVGGHRVQKKQQNESCNRS